MSDTLSFLFETLCLFATSSLSYLVVTVLIAGALGALCWYAIPFYVRLFNKRYRPGISHYFLCGATSLVAVIFTVALFAAGYAD